MKKLPIILAVIITFGIVMLMSLALSKDAGEQNKSDLQFKSKAKPANDYCLLDNVVCEDDTRQLEGAKNAKFVASPPTNNGRMAWVTAYNCLDGGECMMASGGRAFVGAVACPRSVPLWTKVKIGVWTYTCLDRTSEYIDGTYDLFFGYGQNAYNNAVEFGRQWKQVEILN